MPRQTKNPIVILALSQAATATALGVQPRVIAKAVAAGALPVHRIGAKTRIMTSDIEAWLRSLPAPAKRQRRKRKAPTNGNE